jgi:hypothetical protein
MRSQFARQPSKWTLGPPVTKDQAELLRDLAILGSPDFIGHSQLAMAISESGNRRMVK